MTGCSTPEGDTDWFTERPAGQVHRRDACSTPEGDTDWFTGRPAGRRAPRGVACSTPEGDTDWFTMLNSRHFGFPSGAQRPKATLIGSHTIRGRHQSLDEVLNARRRH